MLRPRIIPCLLVHNGGLVKTVNFSSPKYVGDPINAVKIFNEKEADELIILDIDASKKKVEPNYQMIVKLASESRMPLCYGGGVYHAAQAKKIISLGVEKVAISSAALQRPELILEIAEEIGRQSVVFVADVRKKKSLFSKEYEIVTLNGTVPFKGKLIDTLLRMKKLGAGEIVINSIDRDGKMVGYDLALAKEVKNSIDIPTTFIGGAGCHDDIKQLILQCGIVGASAGSLFVFKGPYRAVLINYPNVAEKDKIYKEILG